MTQFDPEVAATQLGNLLSIWGGTMGASTETDIGAMVGDTGQAPPGETPTTPTTGTSGVVPTGTGIAQAFGGEHGGIDFSVPVGTNILAMTNGTVTHAADDDPGGYGSWIEITSPEGIVTRYGHMSGVSVKQGDSVKAGQAIGASGGAAGAQGAGNSTGPHLHFEVRQGGVAVDPTPFLAGGYTITDQTPTTQPVKTDPTDRQIGNTLDVLAGGDATEDEVTTQTEGVTTGDDADPNAISSFLSATKQHESGGDYTIYNQSGLSNASGAYQFIGSTWNNYGGYKNAAEAPPAVQDAKAREMAQALFEKYHSWRLVAIAWYGGPGIADQVAAGKDPGAPSQQGSYLAYGDTIARMMAGAK